MTRTLFLNFFYGLLYHLTKKQPSLSTSQIMRGVLIVFPRGYYVKIDPTLKTMKINLYFLVSHSLLYMGGIK